MAAGYDAWQGIPHVSSARRTYLSSVHYSSVSTDLSKILYTEFNENPFSSSLVLARDRWTNRHGEANLRISEATLRISLNIAIILSALYAQVPHMLLTLELCSKMSVIEVKAV